MQKRDSLKSKTGDGIIYGYAQQTQHCHERLYGKVLHVTKAGGIKVRNARGQDEWVPYHHVIRLAGPGDESYDSLKS